MSNKIKTLGQIAYEADPRGGIQNFGPWENAPEVVKSVCEAMADAVERKVRKNLRAQGWKMPHECD